MKKCRKCGKDLSMFYRIVSRGDELCRECKRLKQHNIEIYHNKLLDFYKNKCLSEQNTIELTDMMNKYELTSEDVLKSRDLLDHLKMLTAIKQGYLHVFKTGSELILKNEEVCHIFSLADLIEGKSKTHFIGVSQGISIRIAKGISYRAGAFEGKPVTENYQSKTDSGILYITNKRIIFNGAKKNISYALDKIIKYTIYKDGIQFIQENETNPKFFEISNVFSIELIDAILLSLLKEKEENLSKKDNLSLDAFNKELDKLQEVTKITFPAIIGDMVIGLEDGTNTKRKGKVIGTKQDNKYLIRTGKYEWVGFGVIKIDVPKVGDQVWGKWEKDDKWYKGMLKEIQSDKFVIVTKSEPWVATEITCL